MIRGTTPTHEFTIPFEVSLIADLRISYGQSDKEVLTKTKKDCTLEGNKITVTLSQEDTLKFECSKNVLLQMRVLTTRGKVLSSEVITVSVGRCINSEVLQL